MQDLMTAIAMVFVIEGLFYFLAPETAQKMLKSMLNQSPDSLRKFGGIVAVIGAILVLMIRN